MAQPSVNAVRGIELGVRDVAASTRFYEDCWGLAPVSREADAVHLRATGRDHQALTLRQSGKTALRTIHTAAADKSTVDALYQRAKALGIVVLDAPAALPAVTGGGYGFAVAGSDGIRVTVSCDVKLHEAVIDDRTKPQKFSHVVLRSSDQAATEAFFRDLLGFRLSDRTDGIDFLRCARDHHSVALAREAGVGLHHMAFELPDLDALMYAAGRMSQKGHKREWGIGRHSGPGNNVFSFFVEPNGFACEYTTDMEQVDDATYPQRSAAWWAGNRRYGPDAWGLCTQRSPVLAKARTGVLSAEHDARCDDIISAAMTLHVKEVA